MVEPITEASKANNCQGETSQKNAMYVCSVSHNWMATLDDKQSRLDETKAPIE